MSYGGGLKPAQEIGQEYWVEIKVRRSRPAVQLVNSYGDTKQHQFPIEETLLDTSFNAPDTQKALKLAKSILETALEHYYPRDPRTSEEPK